jgi:hypothetical protein
VVEDTDNPAATYCLAKFYSDRTPPLVRRPVPLLLSGA